MKKEYKTKNEQETLSLGEEIAHQLQGGEVIGLSGELGAGKTVLIRGLAGGLGIKKLIKSPTFNIMKVYQVKNHPTIKNFVHIDAYRLQNWQDLQNVGIEEYLNEPDSVVVVEWIDRFKKLPQINNIFIWKIKNISKNLRKLILN